MMIDPRFMYDIVKGIQSDLEKEAAQLRMLSKQEDEMLPSKPAKRVRWQPTRRLSKPRPVSF